MESNSGEAVEHDTSLIDPTSPLDEILKGHMAPQSIFNTSGDDIFASADGDSTQLDDWLHLIYNTSTVNIPVPLTTGTIPTESTGESLAAQPLGGVADLSHIPATRTTLVSTPRRTADGELDVARTLNGQLRALCTSTLQFDALCRFFDFVAQCFHLLPSSQNLWRKVFSQLCMESPLILKLTTAVGLVSLTLCGTVHKRPLAYALIAQSLTKWTQMVEESIRGNSYVISQLTALEIIAGAILIGHFEQFDVGLANHTTQCMREVNALIHAVISCRVRGDEDIGGSSQFRFLVRVYLWWDTFSQTLAESADQQDTRAIFDAVHQWEEAEDDVIQSCQCVTGWPLSLLETVAKICQRTRRQQLQEWEIKSFEAEILTCRPRVVPGDNLRIAEFRYVIFEMLAAGVLIFFHRRAYGHCSNVKKEVKQIVHFLGKRDRERLPQTTSKRKEHPSWTDRAPDGTLAWVYFQAAMAAEGEQLQSQCEKSLNNWIAFNDCAALSVAMILLRTMWVKLGEEDGSHDHCVLYKQVCQERRWLQPLVF